MPRKPFVMLAGARAAAAESGVAAQPGRRMNHFASLCSHLALVLLLPGGCVYLPETTTRYDPDCGIYERKATMQPHQVGSLMGCQDEGCAVLLVAAGAVTAASAVISGSVVVIGNVVYWLEKQGQCRNPPREPRDSGALPANRQGAGRPP
jgi:hypothetical protein